MAIGSIINLGGGGGSSLGGKGLIIVDTSSMVVGDKVRVRSVYDSLVTEDKQVATVGTPLYFNVEPYDYYKVCMVVEISDVETEVGGAYTTIDVGQTVRVAGINNTTLAGIQSILNAHQELDVLNIGDEIDITVGGIPWTMQIGAIDLYDTHEVIFVSKKIWSTNRWSGNSSTYYADQDLRTATTSFFSYIAQTDSQYIKNMVKSGHISAYQNAYYKDFTDKIWLPNAKEVLGSYPDSGYVGNPNKPPFQFPLFVTQSSRVRESASTGLPANWWTCDGSAQAPTYYYAWGISTTGTSAFNTNTTVNGIVPCFHLTADS